MGTGLALLGTGIGVTGNQDRRYWEPVFALLGTRIGVKLGTGIFVTGNQDWHLNWEPGLKCVDDCTWKGYLVDKAVVSTAGSPHLKITKGSWI